MMKPTFGMKLVMKLSTPHSTGSGTPMIASAAPSRTPTMSPKTAVTRR